jgi:hypothetical protein
MIVSDPYFSYTFSERSARSKVEGAPFNCRKLTGWNLSFIDLNYAIGVHHQPVREHITTSMPR